MWLSFLFVCFFFNIEEAHQEMAAPAGFIREHQLSRTSCRRSTMAWPQLPGARPQLLASRPRSQLQNGSAGSTGRLLEGWDADLGMGNAGDEEVSGPAIQAGFREARRQWKEPCPWHEDRREPWQCPVTLGPEPSPAPALSPTQELVRCHGQGHWAEQSRPDPKSPTPAQVRQGWTGTGLPPHPCLSYTGVTGPQSCSPHGAGAS